jgi:polar amino acid transport system substrate-binding protein/glutamine transport system substrate-binding protein
MEGKMKKHTKKALALLLVVIMGLGLLAGCGSAGSKTELSAAPSGAEPASTAPSDAVPPDSSAPAAVDGAMKGVTLKIGTSGLFGPFTYYDKDGTTLIGYDIDLINALQKKLGFEIDSNTIQAMSYSALTTSVAEGKLDMAAAALCVTEERQKVIDFSDIYQDSGLVVMVNSTDDKGITSVDSLAGKTVAVEKGTASHAYATKFLTNSTIEVHDTITTAYLSLEQQKVDAVIQDGPGAAFYIKTTTDSQLKVVGDEFNQGQSPYALAFTKGFKYVDLFNAALKELEADGTIKALEDKWCK